MVRRKKGHLWQAQLVIFFILLAVVFVFSVLVRIVATASASLFDGYHRFTVVVDTKDDVSVVTLEPKTKRASTISLSRNVLAQAPVGVGEYQLGKVFALGRLEERGGQLLLATTQLFLGVPVDGWIACKVESAKCKVQSGRETFSTQNLLSLLVGLQNGSIDTNLTPIDIVRIAISLQQTGEGEKKKIVLLEHVAGAKIELLPDGIEVVRVRESSIDRLVREHFLDTGFLEEKLAVSVVNSTDSSGLGGRIARILTNAGVNVVSVTGTSSKADPLDRSVVEVQQQRRKSYTLTRIASIFSFDIKEENEGLEDMRIVLGKDLWK